MTITKSYDYHPGSLPLLVSIPHAGTRLTPAVENGLNDGARPLPDTDWHIPMLYDFARQMGAHILQGTYSRMVIDLNLPPDDKPLYTTATTGLYPETLFDGTSTFAPGKTPSDEERRRYLTDIWYPYHQRLQNVLSAIKARHGYALLFNAHSIASRIPRLFNGTLPSLNIGTNQGASCVPSLEEAVLNCCLAQPFSYVFNGRFKGAISPALTDSPMHNNTRCSLSWRNATISTKASRLLMRPPARASCNSRYAPSSRASSTGESSTAKRVFSAACITNRQSLRRAAKEF